MSENAHAQTAAKKLVVVVLLTLAPEVEKKIIEELKTEIHKALQEGKSTTYARELTLITKVCNQTITTGLRTQVKNLGACANGASVCTGPTRLPSLCQPHSHQSWFLEGHTVENTLLFSSNNIPELLNLQHLVLPKATVTTPRFTTTITSRSIQTPTKMLRARILK